jgi:hypothetical protein
MGRRSNEVTIQEEDEGLNEEDDIEEVEAFQPVIGGPGEKIEEQIFEEDETPSIKALPALPVLDKDVKGKSQAPALNVNIPASTPGVEKKAV